MKTHLQFALRSLAAACVSLTSHAMAATMSASSTAPAINDADIANYGDVSGTDKWFLDAARGQSVTTGGAAVRLKSITYQISEGNGAAPTKSYTLRVGRVTGTVFTQIQSETATQDFSWPSGQYMTWTFDTPVLLEPYTTYGIDVGMTGSTGGWQTGIPYINVTTDDYAGGTSYTSGASGVGTSSISSAISSDRTFHLDIERPLGPTFALVAPSPADNATDAFASREIVMTFSQNVTPGAGNLTIRNLTDNTSVAIPPGDSRLTYDQNVVRINPAGLLTWNKNYAIRYDAGFFLGDASAPIPAITDDTTWNFTTLPNDPLLAAIAAIKGHVNNTAPLTGPQISAHKTTIDNHRQRFAENTTIINAVFDLITTYDVVKKPLFVSGFSTNATSFDRDVTTGTAKNSISPENYHWVIYTVMQHAMDLIYTAENLAKYEVTLNNYIFGSHTSFPGPCSPPANPANTHTVPINGSFPVTFGRNTQDWTKPARKPTGTYLAPGTIATVTVPASFVNAGYKIRVGAHAWDLSTRRPVNRLERATRLYPINATTIKIASPYGGGIYIEVPLGASAGVANVTVTGGVRAPYFSAKTFHQTTPTEWTTERTHPAPWADFQSDKFMCQVPRKWIYNMTGTQATQLMVDWDKAMDAINDLMGFDRNRGKETMYCQTDVILRSSVHAPGYPAVNVTSNVNSEVSPAGYGGNYLVRGPATTLTAANIEFHEQGHGYGFPKFGGESESNVNLLQPAMLYRGFGKTIDEAQNGSFGSGRPFITVDTTAIAWMCVFSFSPNEIPMQQLEKSYQQKGHAKWMDIARIYATPSNPNAGWEKLDAYWRSFMLDDANNVPYGTGTDDLLLRLSRHVGKDIRPLFHFWGIHPQNPTALAAALAADNLTPDPAIKAKLLHYKSIVPADNAAFQSFCLSWWGKKPTVAGAWEETDHAMQWDETLDADGTNNPSVRPTITTGSKYVEGCATEIRARVDELVELYFPTGMTPTTMSFAVAPSVLNANTITMTAVTVTAASPPVQYYFENTTNATNSGWISTPTWAQTGLATNQSYSYRVKARDFFNTENNWSPLATVNLTSAGDISPPSPDPMAFATPPSALDEETITMTAIAATDANGVEYYFENITNGFNSGWQDSPTHTETLLNESTEYTYRVRARDKSAGQNATAFSATASATTPTPDTTPPAILTSSPADNASDAPVDGNLVITFSEFINANTGFITLENISDATETVIDVNDDSQVTISGRDLTINPPLNLIPLKNYAVRIDATALRDLSGNPFAGITDDTTWNFTTAVVPYVWTKTTGGAQDWTVGTNWQSGNAPSPVSGDTVDFSSANITNHTTLTLGADRTARIWKFGDATTASHDWIVNAGNSIILAGATPTIEVANRTTTLNNVVDGTAGLVKSGTGTLALAGSNTYTGGTTINGGILSVNASAATSVAGGPLSLDSGGRLTISSTNISSASQVSVGSGGGQISASGNYNFTTTGKLTGTGTLTHIDPGGGGSRSLNYNATNNDFTGGIIINGGSGLTFSVNSLTDSANNIAFTAASGTNNFTYGSGAIAPLTLGSRAFEINSAGALNSTILNNNNTHAITISPNLVATGAGAKTLTLNAVAGPTNVFGGNITNGSGGGTVSVTKTGAGTWALSGTNTYSGATQFSAQSSGTLVFRGAASASPNTTFRLNEGCTLGLRDDTAGTVPFGAPMQVNLASAQTSARATTTINVNQTSTGSGSTLALGKLNYHSITDYRCAGATVNVTGGNSYQLQIGSIDLSWGINGSQNLNPTTASITVPGTVIQVSGRPATGTSINNITLGTGAQVFTLDGTSTGNLISGAIKNAADHDDASNPNALPLGVTKSGTGDWTLGSAANTFTGSITLNSTTTSAGTLSYASAAGAIPITFLQTTGSASLSYVGATPRVMSGLITASALTSGTVTLDASGTTPADTISYSNPNSLTGVVTSNTVRKLVLSGANTGSNVFNGAFTNNTGTSNAATLTKNGTGTWVLTGPNAHTGATTVSAGKLFINGDQTAANGAVSVSANATLGGTGIIGGDTTITDTGKLEFSISTAFGSHDKLDLAATKKLTFSGASALTITSTSGATTGDYILLTAPGGIIGNAPANLTLPSGWAATVTKENSNKDLVLHVTSTGVVTDPYAVWAVGGVAFEADTNGDGVKNGIAWLLGAANPSENALSKLPLANRNGGNLRLTFRCLKSTKRGTAQVKVQSSGDLGASDPWTSHEALVPDADSTVNGVVFDTTDDGDFINVIADIPAAGTRLFGRLQATP